MSLENKRCLVTGGAGFIGSHLTDKLIELGNEVIVIDNLLTGSKENLNPKAKFDIKRSIYDYEDIVSLFKDIDIVFHTAAIARTPWTIDDPLLTNKTNITGTLNCLEAARQNRVKRFVHSSSCILYVPNTPYYVSKLAAEEYVKLYSKLYELSTVALRYSNVYGKRQSEKGISPNVFAALRKSKRETGKMFITGDGKQTRDYIHVSDVVRANIMAAESDFNGVVDVCTGINTDLNYCAKFFNCPIEYIDERAGDRKHIYTDPKQAKQAFGFEAQCKLEDFIKDVLCS